MSKFPHLEYAPIVEAIFDIRVKPRPNFKARAFSPLRAKLRPRFPKVDDRKGGSITINMSPSGPRPVEMKDMGLQGYFFKSKDDRLIAQFRIDGFTLNRLNPYTSWSELFPITQELWGMYVDIAKPERVTRLATRYINRITLPPNAPDLDRYLTTPPVIPEEIPADLHGVLNRATLLHKNHDLSANVTQAINKDKATNTWTILLDIDVYGDVSYRPNDPEIMALFAQLREFKNVIFFSMITPHAKGMFE